MKNSTRFRIASVSRWMIISFLMLEALFCPLLIMAWLYSDLAQANRVALIVLAGIIVGVTGGALYPLTFMRDSHGRK